MHIECWEIACLVTIHSISELMLQRLAEGSYLLHWLIVILCCMQMDWKRHFFKYPMIQIWPTSSQWKPWSSLVDLCSIQAVIPVTVQADNRCNMLPLEGVSERQIHPCVVHHYQGFYYTNRKVVKVCYVIQGQASFGPGWVVFCYFVTMCRAGVSVT